MVVPENIYARIQAYKERNGVQSDAGACLQLIIRQLDSLDNAEKMLAIAQKYSLEELQQLTNEGWPILKQAIDAQKQK